MTQPAPRDVPDLDTLFRLFPPGDYLVRMEDVPADEVPEPYRGLLVHEEHMTVTVESFHGSLVDVRVLDWVHDGDDYARKILLALQGTGRIVMFGLVRIHLHFCSDRVRETILSRSTPLGRILIDNDVMRRIEPTSFVRVTPGPEMMGWFGLKGPTPTYGRLAIIHCDDKPAIELLEIVAPA